jgi:hypothetical protein
LCQVHTTHDESAVEDSERGGEHPLKRNRNPGFFSSAKDFTCKGIKHILVGTCVADTLVMVGDGTNDDTANRPEHLQHLRSRGSQLDWDDLAAVCRRVGNEDAPWQALEKLGHENDGERLGKVKGEDEDVQEHEAGQGRPTVSDPAGEGAREKDADERTELARDLKRGLPLGHDDPGLVCRVVYTVFFSEGR